MKQPHGIGVINAALVFALAVSACGSPSRATSRAAACPARAPRLVTRVGEAGTAGLVGRRPVVATICQYAAGPGSKRSIRPLRTFVLRGLGASGLAVVVDGAGPMTTRARHCYRRAVALPFSRSQLLIFRYANGQQEAVSVTDTGCSAAVLTARHRAAFLPGPANADLFAYTFATAHARGPRTPALVGTLASRAAAIARGRRFGIYFDGEAIDGSAPFGTVIFQSLPARTRDSGPGRQVDVIQAVSPSPVCRVSQLALSFLGGGAGAGNDFATLVVRDRSDRACMLAGPIRVTGLNAAGRNVTDTIGFPVAGAAVLSPHAGPITRTKRLGRLAGMAPGELAAALHLIAEYRDGPAKVDRGLCNPLWAVPATWRVVFPGGSSLAVANADRYNPGLVPSGGFVTCRGRAAGTGPADFAWLG